MKKNSIKGHNTSVRIEDSTAGITLIALVVTIVVLIILAGISISLLKGDNGILSRAGQAKEDSANAEDLETVKLAVNLGVGDSIKDKTDVNSNIQQELIKSDSSSTVTGNGRNIIITYNDKLYLYDTETGEVKQTSEEELANTSIYGLSADGTYFIGLKSIGKIDEGEIDNYWKNATSVTIEGKDGYKFTAGHFLHITNYNGYLWDDTENTFIQKTGADVYLCWKDNYDSINSQQDLINYATNNNTTIYWDIFSPEGAWLRGDYYPKTGI